MKRCLIFAGADIPDYSFLKIDKDDYVICADGGYFHTQRLGLLPDVVIGDFDTFSGEVPEKCEVIRYPKEKDDTDTMLAVKLALERGFLDIKIFGAIGGRFDHTFANIQTIFYAKRMGADASLHSHKESIYVLENESHLFEKQNGNFLSLFSYSEKSFGVSVSGVKYPLFEATLENSFPLGISNEIIENFADVEVKNGVLLVIYSKD
ncbi:MAG: thiamine diphosphokinase [Oscillospiraceae bacterium]|nr:thiamine diphosphokinase [Oscillospiraceae bacterium]